jgi:hypothetical protein
MSVNTSLKQTLDLVASFEGCDVLRCPTTGYYSATHFIAQAKSNLAGAECKLRSFLRLSETSRLLKTQSAIHGKPALETAPKSTMMNGTVMFAFVQYVSKQAAAALRPHFEEFLVPTSTVEDVTDQETETSVVPASTDLSTSRAFRLEDFVQMMQASAAMQRQLLENQQKQLENQQRHEQEIALLRQQVREGQQKQAESLQKQAESQQAQTECLQAQKNTLDVIVKTVKRKRKLEDEEEEENPQEKESRLQRYHRKNYQKDKASIIADKNNTNYQYPQDTWMCESCDRYTFNCMTRKLCGGCFEYTFEDSIKAEKRRQEGKVKIDDPCGDEDEDDDDEDEDDE